MEQVNIISETLFQLIDKIIVHANENVQVNGQILLIQGLILNLQFQKITKSIHNIQFNLKDDLLDNYIAFIQKFQLEVGYNYYNISQSQRQMLQIYLNRSDFEIDKNFFVKSSSMNFLYNNNSINQLQSQVKYRIDLAEIPYCDTSSEISEIQKYNYLCINHVETNTFEKCEQQMEELDNNKSLLYCQCQSFGVLFLIKIDNKTMYQQNNTLVNYFFQDIQKNGFFEQTFLFVQGVFVILSFFIYFYLIFLEQRRSQKIIIENLKNKDEEIIVPSQNVVQIRFYPGHTRMFRSYFQFIHSILQFCQKDANYKITKSFRFLLLINQISMLILTSTCEVLISDITIIVNVLINLCILLGFKLISKIFQVIYLFQGKTAIGVVIIYCFLPILYILLMNQAYSYNQIHTNEMDIQITLNLLCSFVMVFFIYEPIAIFIRIAIYKPFLESIKTNQYIPIYHLVYFFIEHSKLSQIYDQLKFI